jgi:hypothetical protein
MRIVLFNRVVHISLFIYLLLLKMGSNHSKNKINYEDVQDACKNALNNKNNNGKKYAIINTMDKTWQSCLIQSTIPIQEEEEMINGILNNNNKHSNSNSNDITVIVYGTNSNDERIYSKYEQLVKLGIKNVFIYTGGMFEWLLLQDIYGRDLFPTTSRELDILKYKPRKQLNVLYIDA